MHRELARHAAEQGIDVLVAVGSLAGPAAAEFTGERHTVADAEAAAELVGGLVRPGDTVLVKGSRGVGLERVVEELAGTSADGSEHGELASASRSGGGGRR
jgi:UDP-N-acetylmuramyl pentapeptide synthase